MLGGAPPADWDEGWMVRIRSPRIMTSGMMTVLPPSMMFCVPTSVALRATLLPVSVSMYSPLGGRRDILADVAVFVASEWGCVVESFEVRGCSGDRVAQT